MKYWLRLFAILVVAAAVVVLAGSYWQPRRDKCAVIFSSIQHGMSMRRVIAILGSDGRNLSDPHPYILGMWHWQDDNGDLISVDIGFDPDRRVEYRRVTIEHPNGTKSAHNDDD